MTSLEKPLSIIEDCRKLGFDLSLIDANLQLSPEARAVRHQGALDLAIALSSAAKHLRDGSQSDSAAAVRR